MKQALLVAIPLCLGCAVASAQVGNITFETSASPQAQEHFLRGVAILHSFGFVDAIEEFQKAQELEPDFALAYWGEATAHNGNPLRSPTGQDLPAARNALKKLGGTREERLAKARSEKEKMWMEAVEILYGAGDKESRDWAYAEAMSKIVDAYPGDEEARAFYALALLGTVRRAGNDFRQQMTAAAVAQGLLRQNPRHPGAAHYIIHAFDDPLHAPLALYAADRYAEIAPDVEHALHMPSHIFVQLGLWEKVVKSNKRAYQASVEWVERKELSDTRRDFHALAWMHYGYLERGELEKAKACIDLIRPIAERENTLIRIRATDANMTARYLIEGEDWDALPLPVDSLLQERRPGDVFLLLAAGMRAIEKKDIGTAEKVAARLKALSMEPTDGLKSHLQGQVTLEDLKTSSAVASLEMAALVRLAKDEKEEAVRFIEAAIEKEKEMHPAYGPPEPMVPPQELYGYILLKTGRYEEAAKVFDDMIARMPNRTKSLVGAARTADAMGDRAAALAHYERLASLWSESDETARSREVKEHLNASE